MPLLHGGGVDTQAKSLVSFDEMSSDIDIWSVSRAESMLLRKLAWNPTGSLLKRTVAFAGPLLSTLFLSRRYIQVLTSGFCDRVFHLSFASLLKRASASPKPKTLSPTP